MKDAWAVALKEWRELAGESGMQGRQGILLFIAAFGVLLPLMNGRAWIASPVIALAWSWVPMFMVATVIADAFAGERERHTLETLLATRLSESAILFGKMGAAIGYAAALSAASVLIGIVVVNATRREGGLVLYQWQTVAGMITIGAIGAVFVAALGSLISLRAPTVRQAQQTLGGMVFVLFMLPIYIVKSLPDTWKADEAAMAAASGQIAVIAAALFILIDVALVTLALSRFRRARIIAG